MNDTPKFSMRMVTDTGQWRLVLDIASRRLSAWLRQLDDPDAPMYSVADCRWNDDDVLANVENAVYDNPAVLDDFEADVVVTTPRYIFLPAVMDADEALCRSAFSRVFGETAPEDVMIKRGADRTCVFMLAEGLRSFLGRTLAGSRVTCAAARLADFWQKRAPQKGTALFADCRGGDIDVAVFTDGRLMLSARREKVGESVNAFYFVMNFISAAGATPADTQVILSGDETADELLAQCRDITASARRLDLPGNDNAPLAAIACAYRKTALRL